jgi:hypothetical protein
MERVEISMHLASPVVHGKKRDEGNALSGPQNLVYCQALMHKT